MWPKKPASIQRRDMEDFFVWQRRETISITFWKCKVYAMTMGIGCFMIAPFFAGMPFHDYWRWIGLPILFSILYCFAVVLFNGAILIGALLDKPRSN